MSIQTTLELTRATDDLRKVTAGFPPFALPRDSTVPLSPRIGMCIRLKHLYIKRCSHIPSEISNCQSLKRLKLQRCTDQIDLPQGITLYGLKNVLITGGTWNEERICGILSWLASSAPNLKKFCVFDQIRETASLFMDGLSRNTSFIDISSKITLHILESVVVILSKKTQNVSFSTSDRCILDWQNFVCMTTVFEVYKISER